jgi:hypothetical protein
MITLPKPARLDLLVIQKLFSPDGVRCGRKHLLSSSRFDPEDVINMTNRQQLKAALPTEKLIDLIGDLLNLLVSIFVIHHCWMKTMKHGPDGKKISLSRCSRKSDLIFGRPPIDTQLMHWPSSGLS